MHVIHSHSCSCSVTVSQGHLKTQPENIMVMKLDTSVDPVLKLLHFSRAQDISTGEATVLQKSQQESIEFEGTYVPLMYVYTHTHTHACAHIHMHMHMHMHTHVRIHAHMHTHTCTHTLMHTHTHTHTHTNSHNNKSTKVQSLGAI